MVFDGVCAVRPAAQAADTQAQCVRRGGPAEIETGSPLPLSGNLLEVIYYV